MPPILRCKFRWVAIPLAGPFSFKAPSTNSSTVRPPLPSSAQTRTWCSSVLLNWKLVFFQFWYSRIHHIHLWMQQGFHTRPCIPASRISQVSHLLTCLEVPWRAEGRRLPRLTTCVKESTSSRVKTMRASVMSMSRPERNACTSVQFPPWESWKARAQRKYVQ